LFIIAESSISEQPSLLVRKLKQCCIIFDFDDPLSDVRSKEVKRMCLVELVDFISKPGVLSTEELYMEFMRMVCCSTAAFVFSDGHFQMFSWLTNFKVVHYVYIFQFIHCIELLCVCACLFVPLWFVHTGCSLVVVGCPGGWLTSSATIITWPQLV